MNQVIDCRLRPSYDSLSTLNVWRRNDSIAPRLGVSSSDIPNAATQDATELVRKMDEHNVLRGLVPSRVLLNSDGRPVGTTNDALVRLVAEFPNRFIPFGVVSISLGDTGQQTESVLAQDSMAGIVVEPGYERPVAGPSDRRYYPAYEYCEDSNRPVMITLSALLGDRVCHAHPGPLEDVCLDFPDLRIIIGHSAWPYIMESCAIGLRYPNVWLLPDIYWRLPGREHFLVADGGFLRDRLLYGSAYPLQDIGAGIESFLSLQFSESTLERILFSNAAELLDLDDDAPQEAP